MDGRVGREVYAQADLKVCDSRILSLLARMRGVTLPVYPGSDMTADLLESSAAEGLTIAVFGPDRAAFNTLALPGKAARYLKITAPEQLASPEMAGTRTVNSQPRRRLPLTVVASNRATTASVPCRHQAQPATRRPRGVLK